MRSLLSVLFFVAMTFICWGLYGPVLHEGQLGLGIPGRPSSLRPLICVGIAYFLIAVIVPVVMLQVRGEKGHWTISGAFWSFLAGAAGAVGALGIVMAFKFGGRPVFVMPLVFGLAPVMNTFVTMWMTKTLRLASPIFIAGVIIVAIGAAGVMYSKPTRQAAPHATPAAAEAAAGNDASSQPATVASQAGSWLTRLTLVPFFIALTACCWGSYGPVLHKGQMKMAGSRMRPFLCVGLAYFVIAVLAPLPLLQIFVEAGGWTFGGVVWSLAGGAAGALGALGIIMAFNFGGKPIYVMPLVFGGAPVINTFTTILHEGTYQETTALFYASLMLVIGGAVTVLIFAPRGKPEAKTEKPKPALAQKPDRAAKQPDLPSEQMDSPAEQTDTPPSEPAASAPSENEDPSKDED
jgi:hypothetical protein